MTERFTGFGNYLLRHKKAGSGLGAAALGAGVVIYFGSRAIAQRRQERKLRGELPPSRRDTKEYKEALGVFENPEIDQETRKTMAHVAADVYLGTIYHKEAVVMRDDLRKNPEVNRDVLDNALSHLGGLIGERPNPKYFGWGDEKPAEPAEPGYCADMLDYEPGGIEQTLAPAYYDAVTAKLAKEDDY